MNIRENRLTAEELQKLRRTDFSKKTGFERAGSVLAREVGSSEREEARAWYYG